MLRNDTAVPEETTAALDALRILVEPIDLANGAPAYPSPTHICLQGNPPWLALVLLCPRQAAESLHECMA